LTFFNDNYYFLFAFVKLVVSKICSVWLREKNSVVVMLSSQQTGATDGRLRAWLMCKWWVKGLWSAAQMWFG